MLRIALIGIMLLMAVILAIPLCYLIALSKDNYLLLFYAAGYVLYLSTVMVAVYQESNRMEQYHV